uniref:Uncharacterized protein n=1 Tax=Panagrolaimus sp. ES5 TaxID=591445 RepID=A0AC34GAA5_9BILA
MKLCSSNVLLNKDSKWPFKITSNSKNEVLIEFDTFRGRRKTAPDFFIGMILKFCMGLVEKESGMKFEELGIEFDGLGNNENFMECFEKAAKRVNLKLAFL